MEFHGIPRNCSGQRNWRILSSMEFHGTARISEIGALLVPWNSMELLVSAKLAHSNVHGIPWNSMGRLVSEKLAHFKFHGIPQTNFPQTPCRFKSWMEFVGQRFVVGNVFFIQGFLHMPLWCPLGSNLYNHAGGNLVTTEAFTLFALVVYFRHRLYANVFYMLKKTKCAMTNYLYIRRNLNDDSLFTSLS